MISKKRLFAFSLLIVVVIIFSTIFFLKTDKNSLTVECVPDADTAIQIGKAISYRAYDNIDCSDCEWKTFYNAEKEEWIVYLHKEGMLGGGLPEIHIRKKDAKVTFIALMA